MILAVAVCSLLGGVLLFWADHQETLRTRQEITRKGYGQGDRQLELEVRVDGEETGGTLEITVGEKQYTDAQITELFDRAGSLLETRILGDNESLDQVSENLDLCTGVEGLPVSVEWELDRYDLLTVTGEIQEKALEEELEENPQGVLVNLKAYLTYTQDQTRQAMREICVRLCREKQGKGELLLQKIQEAIEESDKKNKTKETITLPTEVDGKKISYYAPLNMRGAAVAALGLTAAGLLFCLDRQNRKKEQEETREQMLRDYPEIISQMTLLLGAGMSSKKAWKKIVDEYEDGKSVRGKRAAYEEMAAAWNEMCSGMPEQDCYERFGSRCGLQCYMKMGALLSQNLKKGTRGAAEALKLEGIQSFEERKALAKRRGEEAGTRLLLPMFLMLAVVLVIVIVPAFFSIPI